ncbi:thyroxine 5-deiodinase-like [Ptychodera flava]|uniref:thyroxine 5-deiodinase-like n=1 Tax=Ptychodera flava TaxID=63121 RepID=UPI00396A1B3F
MADFIENRDLVIKVLRRFLDLLLSDDTMAAYDKWMNPFGDSPRDLVKVHKIIIDRLQRQALVDNGIDPEEVAKELAGDILLHVLPRYGNDPEAIVHSGSLMTLYQKFRERADFVFIYCREAHPKDGWYLGSNYSFLTKHKDLNERIAAARTLLTLDKYHVLSRDPHTKDGVPMVVDNMDNDFAEKYVAIPDRALVIEKQRVQFVGRNILLQLEEGDVLMTDELNDWLEERFPGSKM